jgi:hypothetical protein
MEGQGNNLTPNPIPNQEPVQTVPTGDTGTMAETPANTLPVSEKPKKSKVILAAVICGVVILGLVISFIIAFMSGGDDGGKKDQTVVDNGDDGPKELSKTAKAQNKLRESDIERFLDATKEYAKDNGGASPFGTKFNAEKIGEFVKKYLEENVDTASIKSGASMKCKDGEACKTIKDPDNKAFYGWTVDLAVEAQTNAKISYSNEKVDHIVHVYAHAICGDKEGTYISGSDDNQVAMYYIEEGGKIVCGDNISGLSNPGDEQNVNKENVARRNVLRENFMASFLKHVEDYQTNNNGKTPFGEMSDDWGANNLETNYSGFVKKYIDSDVLVATSTATSCGTDEGCPRFRDPDGSLYNIKVFGPYDSEKAFARVNGLNYVIYVFVKSECTARYSIEVKPAENDMKLAVIYRLDGGNKFYCIDNK